MVHVTNFFLLVYQLGICCVYIVFIGDNLKSIVDDFYHTGQKVQVFMLIMLLPIILLNWVRNLKLLAPFSTVANAITVLSFIIICYFIFREPVTLEDRAPIGPVTEFPLFFGVVLFSMEAIGVIMPLENEMKTPKSFVGVTGVLNRAFFIIVIMYVGMGVFGYLKYGAGIEDSITLNLSTNSQMDRILANLVKGMLTFGIFITHGVACYVAIDLIWNKYVVCRISSDRNVLVWEYVVRTAVVLVTFLLAACIPKLELFISLFGALCLSTLGLMFPALIETCVFLKETTGTARTLMIIKNLLIGLFGLAGFFIGTATSLNDIIEYLKGP
ncbi:proton-coupled amino acid transporter-like protein CG1139 [Contarinia nasturtii]|uniref:proton-coupled amino acid transporter-like protein CG1139 n=1 Tax=Contarinia nasturtii TaxID=265458 RepID=UPI0012D3BE3B|nr:proton-coupled amino acid transporter-like protein CG1139 [Contarinia nasturtii]